MSLPLCSLCFPPIDLCRFQHVVQHRVLVSRYIKLCAMHCHCGNRLLTLACVCDCHHHQGLPLADFVQTKLCPQYVTSVSHEIQLGGSVIIFRLDVLIDVEIRIPLVRSVVPHL